MSTYQKYEEPLLLSEPIKKRLIAMSQNLNFIPRTVLDIGAFEGYWSRGIKEVFPTCYPFMIEGDSDKEEFLKNTKYPYQVALLSDKRKDVVFHKTTSLYTTGNSIYREKSNFFADSNPKYYTTCVKTKTLHDVVSDNKLNNIDLIKLDVQGSEKDVILGGVDIVRSCKAIIIELSLVEYNKGAPQLLEMMNLMDNLGFKVYDIINLHYNNSNFSLDQCDMIFVPKTN
jgi:FkbM family methyltransferase